MGMMTTEELMWGDSEHPWIRPGCLQTKGPGTYKPPTSNDIPLDMRVHLLNGAGNTKAVLSSKGIGEPPLFLAATVTYALKDAIAYVRAQEKQLNDHNSIDPFPLYTPVTSERLRMSCIDHGMSMVVGKQNTLKYQTKGSW
jgi:xanthine dehydrogenase/oxidase